MHSSWMRTARLLTVYCSAGRGSAQPPWMQTPLPTLEADSSMEADPPVIGPVMHAV